MTVKQAVLLVAHGSPDSAADVPEFMQCVTGGRAVPQSVIEEVQHRYAQIGRSPLRKITERQAELLQQRIALPVYVGMRNWKPFIADAVAQMAREGVQCGVAICLAPQNSRTSVGLYRKAIFDTLPQQLKMEFVESWHDHPLLIQAFAEKLNASLEKARAEFGVEVPVIFTAHSVPERTIAEGDPYAAQAKETAALVAANFPKLNWRFAFQSQGMSGGKWLGPTVEETIVALKDAGHKTVLIQPIGFLCDHVEVLFDIDIVFKQFARQQGMALRRTESLNDSSLLADALAAIARAALQRTSASSPESGAGLAAAGRQLK